jgi:hypothetical protein
MLQRHISRTWTRAKTKEISIRTMDQKILLLHP